MFDRRDLLKGAGLAAMAAALNSTRAMALDTVTPVSYTHLTLPTIYSV